MKMNKLILTLALCFYTFLSFGQVQLDLPQD
ncbi:MAG: hypothetical protein ACI9Z3_001346, partial [Roseivirga sp.]